MARRAFDVIDVVEVLEHWHAGRPKLVIADSLGLDPKTVRKYVAPAEAAGMMAGGPPLSRAEWADLVRGWFPELTDARARSLTHPLIAPFRERIGETLTTNTVTTVHQRLRDEHKLAVSLTSFRRYCWTEFAEQVARDRVRVPRPPGEPGEEAQVDYGYLGRWMDPRAGRMRRVWGFAMILAWSRHMFVRPVFTLDARAWVAAHVAAYAFYGGVPARTVIDNLRTGVDRADLYDPRLNRAYAELAVHFGTLIDPARRQKPRDKAKAEVGVQVAERWILAALRHRTFFSLAEANAAIRERLDWLNARPFRRLPGSRWSLFEELDRPALRPLPAVPYEFAVWKGARVNIDYHVEVDHHWYSVPFQLVGRPCDIRVTAGVVEVFHKGHRVASHPRSARKRQFTTLLEHMPESHRRHAEWTPTRITAWAERSGPSVAGLVTEIMASRPHPEHGFRSCLGIMRLGKRYGDERLEAACTRALAIHALSYRSVESILKAGLDGQPLPGTEPVLSIGDHANVRGAAYYE
jgi:transposase